MRKYFILGSILVVLLNLFVGFIYPAIWWSAIFWVPILALGIHDMFQVKHAILKNFPIVGHFRYILEAIRPEINQYFIESNIDGKPFAREQRAIVYQRAKKVSQALPFGTQRELYQVGYEWVQHSINPIHPDADQYLKYRVKIGGSDCKKPYHASLLNISAMSYGSLSKNAVLALSGGAKIGQFYHNTGEGGISPHHIEGGADLVWQIGTGYFGCRDQQGKFSLEHFREKANWDQVKMIEIKLSQGAKPGHGGILPALKLTEEIAKIRNVPLGQDVISPPGHSAFTTPLEFIDFIKLLRINSGGKPIGFKMCLGSPHEFVSICKAMMEKNTYPDFITLDGGEGGTGAAPLEFSNYVGWPLVDALIFVTNVLKGYDLKKRIKLIVSGRIITGFDIVTKISLGADLCNSARGMLFSIGCIQALRCHTNKCPTGITTQDPWLVPGLVVGDKRGRVANFQSETLRSLFDVLGAMGIRSPEELRPHHLMRRIEPTVVKDYSQIHQFVEDGSFLRGIIPKHYDRPIRESQSTSFGKIKISKNENDFDIESDSKEKVNSTSQRPHLKVVG
jgi:glutamate synthase domain-containing protein 2